MSRIGVGAGVWISSPTHDIKLLSFKLYFECTNNVSKYESLILGLNALKTIKVKKIAVYGAQLVIDQVKGVYQATHPKMRAYRNLVLELLE
jgi:ribonuclease HI